jgi:hypothetical protein
LTNAVGDTAVVSAQASTFGTRAVARFVINLSVVPAPLWAWWHETGQRPRVPVGGDGVGLGRLAAQEADADHSERWWEVADARDAVACGEELLSQLASVGLPRIRSLLQRPQLLAAVRDHRYPATPALAYVCLLADEGPSRELDQERARVLAWLTSTDRQTEAAELAGWLDQRAARSRS